MGRGGEAQASGSPPEVRRDPTRSTRTHDSFSKTRVAYPPFRDTTVARPSSPRTPARGHVSLTRAGISPTRLSEPLSHPVSPHPPQSTQWDVIVVGAGVAGASLAYALGNEGRNVLLLERDLSEPVRIVGELLQPGGYLKLKELGLEHCVDKIDAQKVYGYAMYKDGGEALVGYPLEGRGDDVAGRSFHNGEFIFSYVWAISMTSFFVHRTIRDAPSRSRARLPERDCEAGDG